MLIGGEGRSRAVRRRYRLSAESCGIGPIFKLSDPQGLACSERAHKLDEALALLLFFEWRPRHEVLRGFYQTSTGFTLTLVLFVLLPRIYKGINFPKSYLLNYYSVAYSD